MDDADIRKGVAAEVGLAEVVAEDVREGLDVDKIDLVNVTVLGATEDAISSASLLDEVVVVTGRVADGRRELFDREAVERSEDCSSSVAVARFVDSDWRRLLVEGKIWVSPSLWVSFSVSVSFGCLTSRSLNVF